jgi:hypothetical protein
MSYRPRFVPDQWIKALTREIGKREHVYPGLVKARKMSQTTADYEIAVLTDLRDALADKRDRKIATAQAANPTLF